jgi:hypothetical protein
MLVLGVSGCASAPPWGKPAATADEVEQAMQQCRSELPQAEANYQDAFASRGHTVALDRVREDPQAYAMYRADLLRLCLSSRGHRQADMRQLLGVQRFVPLPPPAGPGLAE